ncbi:MAG: hypothetical protein B7Y81_02700 [Caulobacter sp. 32-67-35]|nr:MAG: hypothetical protein B7Y81_02700 [Caulobacter sp. 32-67-35]OZA77068.1 MAG: hypothetical protein B7X77_05140 [Caulobacter sp. 39-67-4]HQR88010.1 hypothetical protein [Caulobacter sp.]
MARKISTTIGHVAAGLAALSMVAAATTASADSRRHHRHHRNDNKGAEAAIVAGVIGLALGAAIASSSNGNDRYARPSRGYGNGYGAGSGYGYGNGYSNGYDYAPPPRYYGRPHNGGYREDCWTTREYDRRSGAVYERTVCR